MVRSAVEGKRAPWGLSNLRSAITQSTANAGAYIQLSLAFFCARSRCAGERSLSAHKQPRPPPARLSMCSLIGGEICAQAEWH